MTLVISLNRRRGLMVYTDGWWFEAVFEAPLFSERNGYEKPILRLGRFKLDAKRKS